MSFHVVATNVELWVSDGVITFSPLRSADPLFGAFACAGLVDSHAHVTFDVSGHGLPEGAAETVGENVLDYLAAGVTYLRDVGGVSMAAVEQQGARLAAAGRFLAPPHSYIHGLALPVAASDLATAAEEQIRRGARWVKIIGDWFDRTSGLVLPHYASREVERTVAVAHDAGARVAMHCMDVPSIETALEAGVDSIEHALNATEDHVRAMAARRIAWCPTISRAHASMDGELSDATYRAKVRVFFEDSLRDLLPLAASLGVVVLAGSDTVPPADFWREIVALAEYGLSPAQALEAATSGARRFFGVPDLEEGAPADIVLYDADPRDDPAVLAAPAVVMVGGRILSRRR